MLAQDVAADAAADVAGAAGEASGFVTSATNWLVTEGPGLAVNFVFFLAILIIGFWIAKKLSAAAKKLAMRSPNVDETLGNFLGSIVGYVIKAFVIIAAIGKLGVEATSLVAVLGAATLAIGLALQGTLGNVAAGVMLMLFRPYKLGDYVEVAGNEGVVDDVNIFTTNLATVDNVKTIIANGEAWG